MIEFSVGIAVLVIFTFGLKRKLSFTGLFGVAILCAVSYGIGYLLVDLLPILFRSTP